MKKLFTILLTLVFMLSLGTMAFAVEQNGEPVPVTITAHIPKSFEPITAGRLDNPAETFIFTFVQEDPYEDVNGIEITNLADVAIPNTEIAYTAGEYGDKNGSIGLGNFAEAPVGRYTYAVAEFEGNTAGLTYSTRTGTLVVDKAWNGTLQSYLIIGPIGDITLKHDEFDNKFSAGDLNITKVVTGNLGDRDKLFDVTVALQAPDGKLVKTDLIKLMKGTVVIEPTVTFNAGVAIVAFQVKHDDTFTIVNLPYGVTYTVMESAPGEGYSVSYSGDTGTIGSPAATATITNLRATLPDTGINLDSLPYILLLSGAVIGMGALFIRRRQNASL